MVGRPHLGRGTYPVYRRYRRDDRPYFIGDCAGLNGIAVGLGVYRAGQRRRESSAGSMVGSLYERDDLRELRDAGFSIFYISINIGGFLGPLLTGILQDRMGFHYGFGAAAVGMAFGLLWYSRGRKNLPHTPAPNPLRPEKIQTAIAVGVLLVLVLGSVIASGVLNLENFSRWLLGVVIITVIAYFARLLGSSQVEAANKRYIMAYIPLFLTICMFWAVWFQVYTVATVYFDETVDRTFFGFTVPVSWKDSIQAMWVVLFSGVMATVWTKMGKRQPKTPLKFALAMLVTGVSYLSFIPYIHPDPDADYRVYAGVAGDYDRRADAVADFAVVFHQNRTEHVQNTNGCFEFLGIVHRLYLGRSVV